MNPAPLQNGLGRLPGAPETAASPQRDPRSPGHDLAWQRALEHAQQVDLAAWFVPLKPAAAHVSTPGASPASAAASWRLRKLSPEAQAAVAPEIPSSRPQAPQAPAAASGAEAPVRSSSVHAAATEPTAPQGRTVPVEAGAASAAPLDVPTLAREVGRVLGLPVVPSGVPIAAEPVSTGPAAAPVQALPPAPPRALPLTVTAFAAGTPELAEEVPDEVPEAQRPAAPERGAEGAGREPLRLHAEWSELGVRVWLGADADQLPPTAELVRHLHQWLAGHGERLVSLVCNGRTLWSEEGAEAPEIPASPRPSGAPFRPSPASLTLTPRRSHGD